MELERFLYMWTREAAGSTGASVGSPLNLRPRSVSQSLANSLSANATAATVHLDAQGGAGAASGREPLLAARLGHVLESRSLLHAQPTAPVRVRTRRGAGVPPS